MGKSNFSEEQMIAGTPIRAPTSSTTRTGLRSSVALWAAVVVAFVVRVLFLADKPLWRDEAWVALVAQDPLGAAAAGRAVPLGFLALTRLVVGLDLAAPEISYRLIPLVCGIAVVPLLARWALALGASRIAALGAAWIAAGLVPLVYYSRELKSYEIDLLLAVVAPLLALGGFGAAPASAGLRWALLACVAITPWVSFGGIFAVGAVLAWGWLAWWRRLDPGLRRQWLAATLVFAASFLAAYAIALGAQSGDRWMHQYWHTHLNADRRLWLPAKLAVAVWDYVNVSTRYLFPKSWPLVAVLAAIGAWSWPRPQRGFLLFLYAATAGACAVAVVMDRYLLAHGRHLLFAAPVLLLWTAQGLAELGRRLGPRLGPALALGLPVVMSLWWSAESISFRVGNVRTRAQYFFRYDVLQDVDLAIGAAASLIPQGEKLLVSRKSAYAFQVYDQGRIPDAAFCQRHCPGFQDIARKWLAKVDGSAWILLTDEEIGPIGELLDEAGFRRRQRAAARGVRLWLIERRADAERHRRAPAARTSEAPPSTAGAP